MFTDVSEVLTASITRLISLMTEAVSTSDKSVNFYQTTRRNIPEDSRLKPTWFQLFLVSQLIKKFPVLWDPNIRLRNHKSQTLGHFYPVHCVTKYLFNIHFIFSYLAGSYEDDNKPSGPINGDIY
jgi:hypothetical protein